LYWFRYCFGRVARPYKNIQSPAPTFEKLRVSLMVRENFSRKEVAYSQRSRNKESGIKRVWRAAAVSCNGVFF
jgi:hypothetical protein